MSYIMILTTSDNKDVLIKISDILLKEKLAACTQISSSVESNYWWQGKIEKSKEWICSIKSVKDNFKKIEDCIKKHHNYEVPEIVVIEIVNGNKEYLDWIDNSIKLTGSDI